MQIRAFHIDGYGIFHNQSVPEMPPGLILFVGENESGKTTLMEFFRTVLFGPRRRAENDYPPLRGGSHGGRLRIDLKDGRELIVERRGKQVTVSEEGGAAIDNEPSQLLLGGVDRQTFEKVFSIGLVELQGLEFLTEEAVRGRLLSAGAGLGTASVSETFSDIDKELDGLLTKSGRGKKVIVQLKKRFRKIESDLQNVRNQAGEYARLHKEKAALERQIQSERDRVIQIEARLQQIERLESARKPWIDLLDARTRITAVEHAKSFPVNGLDKLNELNSDIRQLHQEISEADQKVGELKRNLERLSPDEGVLKNRRQIEALAGERQKFVSALDDLPERRSDEKRERSEFEKRLADLGHGWTQERLAEVDVSVTVRQQVQEFGRQLQAAEQNVQEFRAKLGAIDDKDQLPSIPRAAAIVAAASGLLLTILLFLEEAYVSAIGIFLAGFLLAVFLYRYRQRQEEVREDVSARLLEIKEDAQNTENRFQTIQDAWKKWTKSRGFEESIRPEGFEVFLQAIEVARTAQQAWEKSRDRLLVVERYIKAIQKKIEAVYENCGRPLESTAPNAYTIEAISEALNEAHRIQDQQNQLQLQLDGLDDARRRLHEQLAKKKQAVRSMFTAAGVADEEEFLDRTEDHRLYQELTDQIRHCELTLHTVAGTPEAFPQLEAELKATDPAELAEEKVKLNARLEEINEIITNGDQEIGAINQKLSEMDHDRRLGELLLEHRSVQQQLNDAVKRWATLALCRSLLEKARDVYEHERQPRVIQEANRFLQTLVQGRYQMISSLDEHAVQLEQVESIQRKTEVTWSSGLGDQVYLATRLGLAQEFGHHAEPLPLFLDDILVRFDPTRRQAAAKVILDFATEQQVFMFSCHPEFAQVVHQVHQQQPSNNTPLSVWQISDGTIRPLEFG